MNALNPAGAPDAIEPYGVWPTVLTFGILVLFVAAMIAYIVWKLPRGGDGS